jgi:hypothetical protein
MPHSAMMLLSSNSDTSDPTFLAERAGNLQEATTFSDLVRVAGLPRQLAAVASEIDGFLPSAVVNALVGAYRAAAESGTDGLVVTWERSSGFSINIAHSPGTDPATDRGIISVTVKSPPLGERSTSSDT